MVIKTSFAANCNLIGRNIIEPKDLSTKDIKSLVWTASELKIQFDQCCFDTDLIKGANITFLLQREDIYLQALVKAASLLLETNLNIIVDPKWEQNHHLEDIGKYLSFQSDLILCQSRKQQSLTGITKKAEVPIVNVKSCNYVIPHALTDIMTMQSHYACLKNLTVTWIGSPCSLLNTYLCMLPRLGVNINYIGSCNADCMQSPSHLQVALNQCKTSNATVEEYKDLQKAITKSNVLITFMHKQPGIKLKFEEVNKVNKDCIVLPALPRSSIEIDDALFEHSSCLVWKAVEYSKWVYAAIILRLLAPYHHVTAEPNLGTCSCS